MRMRVYFWCLLDALGDEKRFLSVQVTIYVRHCLGIHKRTLNHLQTLFSFSLTLLRMGRLYCRPRAIGGTLFVRLFLNLFRCYHVRYLCTVCEYSSIAACQIYTHALMHQLLDLFEDKSYLTTRMVCPILKKITQTAWTTGTTSTFSLFRYDSR